MRYLYSIPTDSPDSGAASRCRHLKKIFNYTDYHDVDEDIATITSHGAQWSDTTAIGITRRELFNTSTYSNDAVASLKKF